MNTHIGLIKYEWNDYNKDFNEDTEKELMKYRIDFVKRTSRTVEADTENEAVEIALHDLNKLNNSESCWYEDDIENLEGLID